MKILIATDTYFPIINGCSSFGQKLATNLTRRGHQVIVVAPAAGVLKRGSHTHNGVKILAIRSFPVMYADKVRFPEPVSTITNLRRTITTFKPDVIHTQTHYVIGRAAIQLGRLLKVPVVATNHVMPQNFTYNVRLPKRTKKLFHRILYSDIIRSLKNVDILVSPSKTASRMLNKEGLKRKTETVSNGIDLNSFFPQKRNDSILKKYGIKNNLPYFIYVGRLDGEKHIDFLLHSFSRVKTPSQLVVVGGGLQEENLKTLATQLQFSSTTNPVFTGFVKPQDLPAVLSSAQAYLIASDAELQSIATLEAMACGLPIIAANAAALPELVKNNQNGFLFSLNPDGQKRLTTSMERLLSDNKLREKMSKKSLQLIKSHDINKTINSYETIYQKAFKNKRKPSMFWFQILKKVQKSWGY